jgi:hypothetical protein
MGQTVQMIEQAAVIGNHGKKVVLIDLVLRPRNCKGSLLPANVSICKAS